MRGAVGLRAITFALERRGVTVWAVPTVVMPWHPGLGRSTRAPAELLPVQLDELGAHAARLDAVLTGYFASAAQVEAAARLIVRVREARPDAHIVVDPVTGDEAGRYVPDAVAEAIHHHLVPRADMITPNRNELADLAGAATPEAARALGLKAAIVTSAIDADGEVGAWLVTPDGLSTVAHPRVERPARGTGDLFSGVLTAALVSGFDPHEALVEASAATYAVVSASPEEALDLAGCQAAIAVPDRTPITVSGAPRKEVYGVDGCPGGWAVVGVAASGPPEPRLFFERSLAGLVASGAAIAIDIPIGLPERTEGPGRPPEQAVRPLLGPRQSSVFSIPGRAAVYAGTYEEACRLALETSSPPRKVSRQGYGIFDKIREVDGLVTTENQTRIFETHAELAFWRLNGERPMPTAKRVKSVPTREGLAERIALLASHGIPAAFFDAPRPGIPLVDVVDAAALALIARRCAAGLAEPFPDPPAVDARGLRAAIWA